MDPTPGTGSHFIQERGVIESGSLEYIGTASGIGVSRRNMMPTFVFFQRLLNSRARPLPSKRIEQWMLIVRWMKLPTLLVLTEPYRLYPSFLSGWDPQKVVLYAMLDTCSTGSFVLKDIAASLGVKGAENSWTTRCISKSRWWSLCN